MTPTTGPSDPSHSPVEERFADGNMTPVVRRGDRVHRARSAWWPATHALLRHLEEIDFEGSPRLLDMDGDGREVLSYIAGESGSSTLEGIDGDSALIAIARLLRAYHDAVASFVPDPSLAWPRAVGAPAGGPIICHNDAAPWNTIFWQGAPVALIDWDLAAPAPPTWDIAYALWRFVPFYPDDRFGPPDERARRAVLFCDAYGLVEREGIVATILQRQRSAYDTVEEWGRAGLPGFVHLYEQGLHTSALHDIAYVELHAASLRRTLERRSYCPA
ncbi:MAG: aminoglycoside phosphotransferase family protein [Chloroflexia bacterium]|nr:aminoglycoside phosphotransferase family protein [Chloroflexia bacterium]